MGHLGPELTGFLAAWLPPVPARVIEIGCGDGALTARLAGAHFEPAPYIAHELDRADLHEREIAAIERGELKPAGARLALELV